VQVHCMSVIRVTDGSNRVLLRVDKTQYAQSGKRILAPIGGYAVATRTAAQRLSSKGIRVGSPLKFTAAYSATKRCREWFATLRGESMSGVDHFEHQLCIDPFYGQPLAEFGLDQAIDRRTVLQHCAVEADGKAEVWLGRVHRFDLRMPVALHLIKHVATGETPLYFARVEEIAAGMTYGGFPIDTKPASLLLPRPA